MSSKHEQEQETIRICLENMHTAMQDMRLLVEIATAGERMPEARRMARKAQNNFKESFITLHEMLLNKEIKT